MEGRLLHLGPNQHAGPVSRQCVGELASDAPHQTRPGVSLFLLAGELQRLLGGQLGELVELLGRRIRVLAGELEDPVPVVAVALEVFQPLPGILGVGAVGVPGQVAAGRPGGGALGGEGRGPGQLDQADREGAQALQQAGEGDQPLDRLGQPASRGAGMDRAQEDVLELVPAIPGDRAVVVLVGIQQGILDEGLGMARHVRVLGVGLGEVFEGVPHLHFVSGFSLGQRQGEARLVGEGTLGLRLGEQLARRRARRPPRGSSRARARGLCALGQRHARPRRPSGPRRGCAVVPRRCSAASSASANAVAQLGRPRESLRRVAQRPVGVDDCDQARHGRGRARGSATLQHRGCAG